MQIVGFSLGIEIKSPCRCIEPPCSINLVNNWLELFKSNFCNSYETNLTPLFVEHGGSMWNPVVRIFHSLNPVHRIDAFL